MVLPHRWIVSVSCDLKAPHLFIGCDGHAAYFGLNFWSGLEEMGLNCQFIKNFPFGFALHLNFSSFCNLDRSVNCFRVSVGW